jgi:hypothetical protein
VSLNHDPSLPVYRDLSVLGNTTFSTSNLGDGRGVTLRLVSTGGPFTLTWPAWTWLGAVPTTIPANTTALLATVAYGPLDTDVVALWTEEGGGGTVTAVTASAPLASSGGATPDISLFGIVPVANGGTGLAVPGAIGNVLTSTGVAWVSAPPSGGGGSALVDLDTSLLTLGDAARVSGNGVAGAASGTAIANARTVGIVHTIGGPGLGKVQLSGLYPTANFIAGLTLTAGDPVYLSLTSGKLSNDVSAFAPGNVVAEIGIVADASPYVSPLFLTARLIVSIKTPSIL